LNILLNLDTLIYFINILFMRSTLDDDEILAPQNIVLKPGLAGRFGIRGWNRAGLKKK
jgi:hypothetical protein